jgi:hypothetical protein
MSLDHVDDLIQRSLFKNRGNLQSESLSRIHPEIHSSYNSINILVGRQGKGKSVTAWQEIIKIGAIGEAHLIIYITKSGIPNDKTFDALKKLITIPIVHSSNDTAVNCMKTILAYKNLYKEIIENDLQDKIEDSQREEIFSVLQINDFSLPSLHTIVYFEDTSNNPLFKKPTLYFPQLFATYRHIGCSFYFAVQYWKSLPTELKSNATNIFIFSSYSKQQLHYILSQTPQKYTFDQIYAEYQRLDAHGKMVVNAETGNIVID